MRSLQSLNAGEAVRVKHTEGDWGPAKVIQIIDTPRGHLVKTSEGGVYPRNRRHLHKDTSQDQLNAHLPFAGIRKLGRPTKESKQYKYRSRCISYAFRTIGKGTG